jgi:hypothetical protein
VLLWVWEDNPLRSDKSSVWKGLEAFFSTDSFEMAKNWAIVIGINDYLHHPERKLNYAVNDAQQMGKFLSDRAGFDAEHVIQCLGDESHRSSYTYPTCANLLRILKQNLKPDRLGEIDRLWFYFSGHGVSRNGRDYLITSDCLEDEIDRFGLPIDEVIAALQLHKDADIVLILDACRQVLGTKNFDSPIGEATVSTAKERGITTIFSCDYGQFSYELEALQQGAFTYALIEGLSQHTLPHQLETYLRQRVPDLHSQYRRDRLVQTPRIRLESSLKAFHSLLPDVMTSDDITVLEKLANKAELEGELEKAKQIWWQIIGSPQSIAHIREARSAIERIYQKIIDRLKGEHTIKTNTNMLLDSEVEEEEKQLKESIDGSLKKETDLEQIWQNIIAQIEFRGTRVLLQNQGKLLFFNGEEARIGITSQPLFKMVKEKLQTIEAAFEAVYQRRIRVSLGRVIN